MRLLVTTPLEVIVDAPDVTHVRAEDETGAFGILEGHADFVTVLTTSVVSWRDPDGHDHHIAVLGGVLMVKGGKFVEVASREAVGEDELTDLEVAVRKRFEEQTEAAEEVGASSARLHAAMMYQIQRYLDTQRAGSASGPPTGPGVPGATREEREGAGLS